jgi:hypothetical protein
MENGGTRFAIGLLILWGALLLLFIALHPNGIKFPSGSTPGASGALQWLIGEFQTVTGLQNAEANPQPAPQTGTNPVGAAQLCHGNEWVAGMQARLITSRLVRRMYDSPALIGIVFVAILLLWWLTVLLLASVY